MIAQVIGAIAAAALIERFRRAEAHALKPVVGRPPFQAARELIRRVQALCAVEIDGNASSVPLRLIGETGESDDRRWRGAHPSRDP